MYAVNLDITHTHAIDSPGASAIFSVTHRVSGISIWALHARSAALGTDARDSRHDIARAPAGSIDLQGIMVDGVQWAFFESA